MGAGQQDAINYGNPATWIRCRLIATVTTPPTGQTTAEVLELESGTTWGETLAVYTQAVKDTATQVGSWALPLGTLAIVGLAILVLGRVGLGPARNPRRHNPAVLQAFLVSKKARGALGLARHLAVEHGSGGVAGWRRENPGLARAYYHVRVEDPERLRAAGYSRFRTKRIKPGLLAIFAAKGRRA